MKLNIFKAEDGIYVSNAESNYSGRQMLHTHKYRYNKDNSCLEDTFLSAWKFIKGVDTITSVENKLPTKYTNIRWELIDKEDNELKLPEILTPEEVSEWWCDDDEVYAHVMGSGSKYYKYRTFYERKRDIAPQEYEDVAFEVEDLGTISRSNVDNFADMKVVVGKTGYSSSKPNSNIENDLSKIATYSEIEKMLIPDLALHNRPCSVNADTTYKIIRNYVRDNIDGKYARITSDYNFCFTVKKRVQVEPYTFKTEIRKSNGKSYARPRFKTQEVKFKEVEIFEMCPSKPYNKYTPIVGFKGESLSDLAENIKLYLEELMEIINAPLHECEHCEGKGSMIVKVEDINKR